MVILEIEVTFIQFTIFGNIYQSVRLTDFFGLENWIIFILTIIKSYILEDFSAASVTTYCILFTQLSPVILLIDLGKISV